MPLNVPTFFTRLGSSVVFVAVMLTGLLWNEWAFLVLVCLIQALCLRDYFRVIGHINKTIQYPIWLQAAIQVIAFLLVVLVPLRSDAAIAHIIWACAPVLLIVPALLLLKATLSEKGSLMATLQAMGGIFYITLPMMYLVNMCQHHMLLPLSLIVMIWSNDTMAYLVGSFFGKNPLSPISPKKTWEGTLGGALITVIAACVVGFMLGQFRLEDWLALSICATVAGTLGDLLESKLKRMADLKDSGTLMPGHGGALDRFDSLLVAAPFAFLYVVCFMK